MRLTLRDGGVVEGERIATYDHSIWWWEPADALTHAVFDPAGLAEWPEDHSEIHSFPTRRSSDLRSSACPSTAWPR